MIVIAGEVKIRPEASEAAVQAGQRMMAATRAEPGCRAYRFSFDFVDPSLVYIFEEWDSEEALTQHFQTPHMAEFQQAMASFLAGPPAVRRYAVASVSQMM